MPGRVRLRLRALLLRRRLERDMREEMADHLRRATERLTARGLPPEAARREALREFGNVGWLQERGREARGWVWIGALAADVRFALRHFARRPATVATMLVVLVAGMGVSSLLFSYVHAYAVRPPPGVERSDDLVRIRASRTAGVDGRAFRTFSEEELRAYQALTGPFASVAGWSIAGVVLDAGADADRTGLDARVAFVGDGFFRVLGVRPLLGAGLPSGEEARRTGPVAVIGYGAWDRLFGRGPDALGAALDVNGVTVTVVGVAPRRFATGPGQGDFVLWMPLASRELILPGETLGFRAVARLRPGVDRTAATAAVATVPARLAAEDRELRALEPATDVVPLLAANGDPMFERDVRLMTLTVGLLGLLVLLVACTNVSALLTGLAVARRHEIAIRLSLGAGRRRILGQLLTESALLATLAAAGALALVWAVLRAVEHYVPGMPFELTVTGPTTTFTFAVALAVGVLFGLSPALHATRLAVAGAVREANATIVAARAGLQRGLVVAQVALTQPLIVLVAALLVFLLRDFEQQLVGRTELADRVAFVALVPPVRSDPLGAGAAVGEHRAATARLLEQVREATGVEAVVLDWRSPDPLGAYVAADDGRAVPAAAGALALSKDHAAPGFFRMMGIPLVRGREFGPDDLAAASDTERPAIVGAGLARRAFGGGDPIGRRLRPAADSAPDLPTLVVVGVVEDPLDRNRGAGQDHWIYLPPDTARAPAGMLVRTAAEAEGLVPTLRALAREVAPTMSPRVRTLAEIDELRRETYGWIATGVSTAGVLALLLSAIGLYAVVAFSVGHRTAEIAVRIAVGASGRRIARHFVTDALRLSALGLALGLPISLLGLRALRAVPDLPVVPLPPVTALAALGVVSVTIAAAWIPARRAAAVDPAVTLRSE